MEYAAGMHLPSVSTRVQDWEKKTNETNPSPPSSRQRATTEIFVKTVPPSPLGSSKADSVIPPSLKHPSPETPQALTAESVPSPTLGKPVKIMRRSISLSSLDIAEFKLWALAQDSSLSDSPKKKSDVDSEEGLEGRKLTRDRRSRSFSSPKEILGQQPESLSQQQESLIKSINKKYPITQRRDGSKNWFINPFPNSKTLREAYSKQQSAGSLNTVTAESSSLKSPRKLRKKFAVSKTNHIQKKIDRFWEIEFFQHENELLEIFYKTTLLKCLKKALEETSKIYKLIEKKPVPITLKIQHFLAPLSKFPTHEEIFNKLWLLKDIHQLSTELTDPSMTRLFRPFAASKMINLLISWGISGTYHWQKPKHSTMDILCAQDIFRTQTPDGFALSNLFINEEPIIKIGSPISAQVLFQTLLEHIYKHQPNEASLSIEEQTALFLFFVHPVSQEENLLLLMQQLKSQKTDWGFVQEKLPCSLKDAFKKAKDGFIEAFECLRDEYYKSSPTLYWEKIIEELKFEISTDKLDAFEKFKFSHLKACDPIDWESFQGLLKAEIPRECVPYSNTQLTCLEAQNRYKLYLENTFLKLMIPGFEVLQLCSTELIGFTDKIFRTWLHPLKGGTFARMCTDISKEKTFRLTLSKNRSDVEIPLHFIVHPKVNADPACFRLNKEKKFFKLQFTWTVSIQKGDNIQGLLNTKLFIQKDLPEKAVLTILKDFQDASKISLEPGYNDNLKFKPLTIFYEND